MFGCKLDAFYPQVLLVLNTVFGVAVMSYDGCVFFGLLGDYDAMVDFDAFVGDLWHAIVEFMFATVFL